MTDSPFLCVLSVGRGDLKISFESGDPADVERARQVVRDMMARGYLLFVENPDRTVSRIDGFDEATTSYIIRDVGPAPAPAGSDPAPALAGSDPAPPKRRGRPPGRKIPIDQARATGVAPIAGG